MDYSFVLMSDNDVNTGGNSGGNDSPSQTVEIKTLYFKGQTGNYYHVGDVINADSQIVYSTWS